MVIEYFDRLAEFIKGVCKFVLLRWHRAEYLAIELVDQREHLHVEIFKPRIDFRLFFHVKPD